MKKQTNSFEEELVKAVKEDFENRRNERRTLEQQWNLNLNYLMGNQYCEISPTGSVEGDDGGFYWQNKNVYNHIAPIIETRLAKLSRVRPIMSVRASGSEDEDLKTAKISADFLNSTASRVDLDKVIASATLWSEALGTSFYKIMWNGKSGRTVGELDGERVFEGDVDIIAVSPYEIFPDSLFREDLSKVKSLIHVSSTARRSISIQHK